MSGFRGRDPSQSLLRYGPTALVTGASSGIGRAFAEELAALGFDLVLVARREDRLVDLARSLESAHGVRADPVVADLAGPEGVARVLNAVRDRELGLVVCSAGFGTSGPFIEGRLEEECSMLEVNCRSLMTLAWHFGRRFAAQGRGGIVLLSSLVGFQGVPRAAHYAATKAYVQALAEGLHHELRPLGVSVLACAPGPIHSGFAARAGMTMGFAQRPNVVAAATLAALGRRSTVRPGWLSKALEYSLKLLPRSGRVRMMAVVMRGMTPSSAAP
jgi:short-subunit dehydrogenase